MTSARIALAWFVFFALRTASGFQVPGDSSQVNAQVTIAPRMRPRIVPEAAPPRPDLRVDVPLVLIPAHVTTEAGAPVTSLSQDNFKVFEDGIEQKITYFAKEDAPVSVGLVYDSSGSMRNKMRKSWEAASTFLKTANSDDEFFLVEFNERPKLSVAFTSDSDQIFKTISRARSLGRTSLLDAISMALTEMKHARNSRKAIIILSDGGDNRSRRTAGEVKTAMLESDVQLYAIGLFDPEESRKRTPEEANGPYLLEDLAQQTGGRAFPVRDTEELPGISTRIGRELRDQYLLGYVPVNAARDGKYRRVKISLNPPAGAPALQMHHRQGYFAPSE